MANLSEKDRLYYEANRLAITKSTDEYFKDKNAWWNKITAMNEEQLEQLPVEVIRKYAVKAIKTEELHAENELLYNKDSPYG